MKPQFDIANAQPRLIVLALASALMTPVFAADNQTTTLPDVVVTATRDQTPLTVTTDPKLPRQPLPASDGADYLKTIPGFSAIRNGGSNADPVFRGMYGSRLNILTNDAAMLGACPGRMDNPLSYIVPEAFDTLTVVKGPQTVLWGPGASAATVRFERNTAPFTAPGHRGEAGLLAGSWQRFDANLDATAGTQQGYVRFTGSHGGAEDYVDGDGNRIPSKWDKWAADATLGFTPSADTLVEITGGKGDGEARYAGRSMDGSQFLRESAGIKLEQRHISEVLQKLTLQYSYNYADHVMDNYTLRTPDPKSSMKMPMAADVDRRTQSARIAGRFDLADALILDAGIDYSTNVHRGRSGMGRDTYQKEAWSTDARFSNTGVFGELNWALGERQRIISGLRFDFADATDERQQTDGMMPMPNPTAGQSRTATLPSGFVRYEQDLAAYQATWYAGLGHSERFPDYWELFSPDKGPAGSVNAFSGVQPEKTTQLDIGITAKHAGMEGWVSAYAGRINDYILFNYMQGGMMGSTSQASNVDANIAGAELGGKIALTQNWKLDGSLAFAWGENTTQDTPLPQMPPLDARIGLRYETVQWSLGGLWRGVAAQHRYSANQGNVVGKDFGPSSGFAVVSLNGSYQLAKAVKLTAGVDNLFNREYAEHLNLAGNSGFGFAADEAVPEPGRSYWLKLNAKF